MERHKMSGLTQHCLSTVRSPVQNKIDVRVVEETLLLVAHKVSNNMS